MRTFARPPAALVWRMALAVLAALLALGSGLARPARAATPNDPFWQATGPERQWAPALIGADDAWDVSTGSGVTIGIVDTGVDLAHTDLAPKIAASTTCQGTGGDARLCQGDGQDDNGHGTHVAGIAAAVTNNGTGIAGVAPAARLVVAKAIFDEDGESGGSASAAVADINAGIRWAVEQGADVVNLSLAAENFLLAPVVGGGIRDAVEYAWSRGVVVVLAAGNTQVLGLGSSEYGDLNAIVVAASGPGDEPASYSSPTGNAKWALAAPGGDGSSQDCTGLVISTYWTGEEPDQYGCEQGTSMAAPHVAGVLALLRARPGMTAQRAVEVVLASAKEGVGCPADSANCRGRLDAAAALQATGPGPDPTTTTTVRASTSTSLAPTTTRAPTTTTPGLVVPPDPSAATTTTTAVLLPLPVPRTPTTATPPTASTAGGGGTSVGPLPGGDGGGTGPPAVVGGLLVLATAAWAALEARRQLLLRGGAGP